MARREDVPKAVGSRFERARKEVGHTQTSIAELAGVTRQQVGRLESGERGGRPENLFAILRALGSAGANLDFVFMDRGPVTIDRKQPDPRLESLERRMKLLEARTAESPEPIDLARRRALAARKKRR